MLPDANNHSFLDTRKGNRYSSGTCNLIMYHIYIVFFFSVIRRLRATFVVVVVEYPTVCYIHVLC